VCLIKKRLKNNNCGKNIQKKPQKKRAANAALFLKHTIFKTA
jgi:hypothetical protein